MFEQYGISKNQLPKFKKYSGDLLVVGSGRGVWEELDSFLTNDGNYYHKKCDVMCINDIVIHFPGEIEHIYSNDHHWLPKWVEARRPRHKKDFPNKIHQHTCQEGIGNQVIWPWTGNGTSGLNAVFTGLALGYEKIILAGVGIDNSGHYFDPQWKKTNYKTQTRFWDNAKNILKGRIASLGDKNGKSS